jgi:hypothetical protein
MRSLILSLSLFTLAACGSDDSPADPAEPAPVTVRTELDPAVPWEANLVRAAVIELDDGGITVEAYDDGDAVIGSITAAPFGPDYITIDHYYPRPCEIGDTDDDCADILSLTIRLGAEPSTHTWSNAPAELFESRADLLIGRLPDGPQEWRLRCALRVLALVSSCTAIKVGGPLAVPVCAQSAIDAACDCPPVRKTLSQVPWEEIC